MPVLGREAICFPVATFPTWYLLYGFKYFLLERFHPPFGFCLGPLLNKESFFLKSPQGLTSLRR